MDTSTGDVTHIIFGNGNTTSSRRYYESVEMN